MSDLAPVESSVACLAGAPPRRNGVLRAATQFLFSGKTTELSNTVKVAIHGSLWTLIGYGSTQILRTASTVVLARLLLGPREFGLIALVNVFLSGLEMLSDLGIGIDVVQHPRGGDLDFINTAFLIQLCRSSLLWILAMALAYPFAIFYKQPQAFWLAIVAATSIGIRGFTNGSVWTMTRNVRLRELTLLTLSGDVIGLLVTIGWAVVSPSAWALVIGRLANGLVFTVATYLAPQRHTVSLRWDPFAARDILRFGAGMFVSTSTYFLVGEGERLVIGKFVNLVQLGCFSLALTFSGAATKGLQQVITQVFFPLISRRVRENPEVAVKHYKKVRWGLLVVSTCLLAAFIVGGPGIVGLLLGPSYAMTGWMLQLLGFRGAFELFTAATTSLLFSAGTAGYAAAGNVSRLVFLAAGLSVAFGRFGFRQALWVLALSPIAAYVPLLFGVGRHFRPALRTELASCAVLLASAALTAEVASILH